MKSQWNFQQIPETAGGYRQGPPSRCFPWEKLGKEDH